MKPSGKKYLSPFDPGALVESRGGYLPGYAYKTGENDGYFGHDVHRGASDIDEASMSFVLPFADGNRRDGVGDLLEIGGIDTSRHRVNPICYLDHAKSCQLPIGLAEDPQTKQYTVNLDTIAKVASLRCYMYQGKGMDGVERQADNEHALLCEQLFDLVAKKYLRGGSIGYQVLSAYPLQADYQKGIPQGMHLLKTLMLEGSLVVMPCNQDTVRKALCLTRVCGKPMSPILVKSLAPYAPKRKAQMGYEGKAKGDQIDVHDDYIVYRDHNDEEQEIRGTQYTSMDRAQRIVQSQMEEDASIYGEGEMSAGDTAPNALPSNPRSAVGKDGAPTIVDRRTKKALSEGTEVSTVRVSGRTPPPKGHRETLTHDVDDAAWQGNDPVEVDRYDRHGRFVSRSTVPASALVEKGKVAKALAYEATQMHRADAQNARRGGVPGHVLQEGTPVMVRSQSTFSPTVRDTLTSQDIADDVFGGMGETSSTSHYIRDGATQAAKPGVIEDLRMDKVDLNPKRGKIPGITLDESNQKAVRKPNVGDRVHIDDPTARLTGGAHARHNRGEVSRVVTGNLVNVVPDTRAGRDSGQGDPHATRNLKDESGQSYGEQKQLRARHLKSLRAKYRNKEFDPPGWRPRPGDHVTISDTFPISDYQRGSSSGSYTRDRGHVTDAYAGDESQGVSPSFTVGGDRVFSHGESGRATLTGPEIGRIPDSSRQVAQGYQSGDHPVLADTFEDEGYTQTAEQIRNDEHAGSAAARDIRNRTAVKNCVRGEQEYLPQGNPLSSQNVPPPKWTPGVGAVANEGRKHQEDLIGEYHDHPTDANLSIRRHYATGDFLGGRDPNAPIEEEVISKETGQNSRYQSQFGGRGYNARHASSTQPVISTRDYREGSAEDSAREARDREQINQEMRQIPGYEDYGKKLKALRAKYKKAEIEQVDEDKAWHKKLKRGGE